MKLSFEHLAIVNFKSFRGPHDLPLGKFGEGVHFVRGRNFKKRLGSNGAGKSSLWDALTWCLYGSTPDGLKNPDVKPWSGEKKTMVALTVVVDKDTSIIMRTINPNALTIDGKAVGQEQVDSLIGLSFAVWNHTVLLGQGQPLFFDLNPKGKMELFSDVLALERWEARSRLAAERATNFQRDRDVATGSLEALKLQLVQLVQQIDATKGESQDWETKRQSRLTDIDAEILNLKKIIAKMQGEVDAADLAYDGAGTELKQIETDLGKTRTNRDALTKPFNTMSGAVQNAAVMAAQCRHELRAMKPGTECPMCKREFTENSHAKARLQLRERIAKYEAITWDLPDYAKVLAAVDDVESLFNQLERSEMQFREKANAARDILDLKRPVLATFKAKLQGLKDRKEHGDNEENPYRIQLTQQRTLKTQVVADIKGAEEEIETLGRRIERAKFWVKGFRDVRLYVVDEVLQELQLTTNAALEEVGLKGWEIQYSVERETKSGTVQQGLTVSILSPKNDKPVRWESWSGGESQRLRLVGALALSEVLLAHAGVTTNMEILDEPTQHLSPEGVRDVCEYLVERARQYRRQTFYVDHMSVESTRFASVITITKDEEGSYIDG